MEKKQTVNFDAHENKNIYWPGKEAAMWSFSGVALLYIKSMGNFNYVAGSNGENQIQKTQNRKPKKNDTTTEDF